jgi:biopolymer transport protein ExbD
MSWRLRHEGSPQPVGQPLTSEQIVEGLKDGVYASTDEVRGPTESKWTRLEDHPHFAEVSEVVQAMEDEAGHEIEDNNIDMNPLIDVCLVLLVFFILATTMSVMEKILKLPSNQSDTNKPPVVMTQEQLSKYIMLKLEKKNGVTVYNVNNYEATEETLERELSRLVREGKSELILDVSPGVEFVSYTVAVDKAAEAQITKILTKAVGKNARPGAPAKTPAK